jgi:octaprenyl-diphosphate synthase
VKNAQSVLREDKEPDLALLRALVHDDMKQVNIVMGQALESSVPLIPQLGMHLFQAGGKRLRPMLTLGACRLCDAPKEAAIGLAAAIEFIHGATLLHDDVVDASSLRRGRATANALWGNKESILVGDFLFARAFGLMVAQGSLPVLDLLSQTAARLSEGEVLQLSITGDLTTDEATCIDVMTSKTAPLFEAAAGVGALLTQTTQEQKKALRDYGRTLGVCFQIVDDVLDYAGGNCEFGKAVGADFQECKVTLPIVFAYQNATPGERLFWERTFSGEEKRPSDWDEALGYLKAHNAFDLALEKAQGFAAQAHGALALFPQGPARAALEEIISFSLYRRR